MLLVEAGMVLWLAAQLIDMKEECGLHLEMKRDTIQFGAC